MRGSSIGKRA